MSTKGTVTLLIQARDMATAVLSRVSKSVVKFGKSLLSGLGTALTRGGIVVGAVVATGAKLVSMYASAAQQVAKVRAVLTSTGYAAGKTSGEIQRMSSALQRQTGISDDTLNSAQALLLTYTNIRGVTFDRTVKAMVDVSTVMTKAGQEGGRLEEVAAQIGKALNDPVKGLSMLTRIGITFTDQQKKQIATLAESGRLEEAQGVILAELERRFGGAAAGADKTQRSWSRLKETFGDLLEMIGGQVATTGGIADAFDRISNALENLAKSGYIEAVAGKLKKLINETTGAGGALNWAGKQISGAGAFWGALAGGSTVDEASRAAQDRMAKGVFSGMADLLEADAAAARKANAEAEELADTMERIQMRRARMAGLMDGTGAAGTVSMLPGLSDDPETAIRQMREFAKVREQMASADLSEAEWNAADAMEKAARATETYLSIMEDTPGESAEEYGKAADNAYELASAAKATYETAKKTLATVKAQREEVEKIASKVDEMKEEKLVKVVLEGYEKTLDALNEKLGLIKLDIFPDPAGDFAAFLDKTKAKADAEKAGQEMADRRRSIEENIRRHAGVKGEIDLNTLADRRTMNRLRRGLGGPKAADIDWLRQQLKFDQMNANVLKNADQQKAIQDAMKATADKTLAELVGIRADLLKNLQAAGGP